MFVANSDAAALHFSIACGGCRIKMHASWKSEYLKTPSGCGKSPPARFPTTAEPNPTPLNPKPKIPVTIHDAPLSGVQIIDLDVYADDRGDFRELWNAERYREHGLDVSFVQDNLSRSSAGVLRGLHFQNPHPQGKLITVLRGEVYDVVVDVRPESDTFGEWYGTTLSADEGRQLYVPEGFAHGFVVTRGPALFHYKCTDVYVPNADHSIRWNDPALAIDWPVRDPILSDKDADAPALEDLPAEALEFAAPAE